MCENCAGHHCPDFSKELNKCVANDCPKGGDISNDCDVCAYSGEYHFVDGECVLRESDAEQKVKSPIINWDNPEERAGLIERIGAEAYNKAYEEHIESITVATIGGHRIYPVNTPYGRLFNVGGTGKAFTELNMAENYANEYTGGGD